jgi:hypothetical protein
MEVVMGDVVGHDSWSAASPWLRDVASGGSADADVKRSSQITSASTLARQTTRSLFECILFACQAWQTRLVVPIRLQESCRQHESKTAAWPPSVTAISTYCASQVRTRSGWSMDFRLASSAVTGTTTCLHFGRLRLRGPVGDDSNVCGRDRWVHPLSSPVERPRSSG